MFQNAKTNYARFMRDVMTCIYSWRFFDVAQISRMELLQLASV